MRPSRAEQRRVVEMLAKGERQVSKQQHQTSWAATMTDSDDSATRIQRADPYRLNAQAEQPQRSAAEMYWEGVKLELAETQRRFELVAAERDPFTAKLIKDSPRHQHPPRINVFNDRSATITYNVTAGAYQRTPFQFLAAGQQVFSDHWSAGQSIDAGRIEGVERFKAEVEHGLLKSSRIVAESFVDEAAAAENELPVGDATVPALPALSAVPPSNACYVLSLFLSPRDYQALVGDLIEEYRAYQVPTNGERRARFWFWIQAATSIGPIISRRIVRIVTPLAAWKTVTKVIRRFVA